MDKLEIKQGSFIQQTPYSIPVETDLHVYESDFFLDAVMKFKDIDKIKITISEML
jgi:hypothetical protein